MDERATAAEEISEAFDQTLGNQVAVHAKIGGKEVDASRRVKAVSLRLAGLTYAQIGEQIGLSEASTMLTVQRALANAESKNVDILRDVENARLDRAQSAIWSKVLRGEEKAITVFLKISDQRVKLNGLAAPSRVEVNVGIRHEMEQALQELESMVLQVENIEDAEVVEDE